MLRDDSQTSRHPAPTWWRAVAARALFSALASSPFSATLCNRRPMFRRSRGRQPVRSRPCCIFAALNPQGREPRAYEAAYQVFTGHSAWKGARSIPSSARATGAGGW